MPDLVEEFRKGLVTAISMEMIPLYSCAENGRIKLPGKPGWLRHGHAGGQSAGPHLPMMMTPSGTIKPARVFVIGAGVAGLQAIATAKRLGARVTAFDTRAVVAEQVKSLGAGFLKIDLGETGQSADGYALQLTPRQLARQRQGQVDEIARSDIVITTAQIFGRKPPSLSQSRWQRHSVTFEGAPLLQREHGQTHTSLEIRQCGKQNRGPVILIGSGLPVD